jgi:hypothetical protein
VSGAPRVWYTSPMLGRLTSHALLALSLFAGCNRFTLQTVQVTDAFQQSEDALVDILIVVDNSGSMQPYQEKLARDFGSFFDYFADAEVDWQLGVAHTDARAEDFGRLRGNLVTSDAPDPQGLFAEAVSLGTEGGGIEAGLGAAYGVLTRRADDFPREGATLSVIFVSDEEDASPGPVADYVDAFFEFAGQRQRQTFHASALTVTELADCSPEQFSASTPGTRYVEAARMTAGLTANLCVDDLSDIALDLALNTSSQLDTFFLRTDPDPATLAVRVDDVELPCEDGAWVYERVDRDGDDAPAVRFTPGNVPPPGSEVLVEYVRGGGDPADFCPEATPADGGAL